MITTNDLQKIKENLPSNHLNLLHDRLSGQYSKSLIEKVLRGDRYNEKVIEATIQVAEEHRIRTIALKERINTL